MEPSRVLRQLGQSAAVASFVYGGAAAALGLGEISVDSAIDERFAASIPLLTPTPAQRETLSVHVATADDFKRVGIEWSDYLSTLRFRLLDTPTGTRVVIDSDERVREPFLTMIVEASWAGGRLQREYSVLFDPPRELGLPMFNQAHAAAAETRQPAAAPQPAPVPRTAEAIPPRPTVTVRQPAAVAPRPLPTPVQPVAEAVAPRPTVTVRQPAAVATRPQPSAPPAAKPAPVPAGFLYGPVRPHESPRGIASRLHPEGPATQEQVELALYRANPAAFTGGRLDGLIPGSMLKIPSLALIRSEPAASARALILDMRAKLKAPARVPRSSTAPAPSTSAAAPPRTQQPATPAASATPNVVTRAAAPVAAAPAQTAADTAPRSAAPLPTVAAPAVAPPTVQPAVQSAPVPPRQSATAPRSAAVAREDWTVMLWTWSGAFLVLGLGTFLLALLRGRPRQRPLPATPKLMPIEKPLPVRFEQPASPLAAAAPMAPTQIAAERPQMTVAAQPMLEAPATAPLPQQQERPVAAPPAAEADHETIAAALSEAEFCQLYGHFKEAVRILSAAAARAPHDIPLRFKLAEACFAAGLRDAFEQTAAGLHGKLDADQAHRLQQMSAQMTPADAPAPTATGTSAAASPEAQAEFAGIDLEEWDELANDAGDSAASVSAPVTETVKRSGRRRRDRKSAPLAAVEPSRP